MRIYETTQMTNFITSSSAFEKNLDLVIRYKLMELLYGTDRFQLDIYTRVKREYLKNLLCHLRVTRGHRL